MDHLNRHADRDLEYGDLCENRRPPSKTTETEETEHL